MDAAIIIEPYDPAWPAMFEAERALVAGAIGPWLAGPIEHIGSTAVDAMPAKPVIDIMAAVESLEASRPAIECLPALGYCYAPYRADVMHWMCKPGPEVRTHHLHLVPYRSALWLDRIAFRDLLRNDPAVAIEYAALKVRLAGLHRGDREWYTEAKGPFIVKALAQMAWTAG